MKAKRRRNDPEVKARVALEALRGIKTIQQIAKEFDIHPVQMSEWKKIMADGAASVFSSGNATGGAEDFERARARLHAKIGEQAVALDFLEKSPNNSICEGSDRVGRKESSLLESEKTMRTAGRGTLVGELPGRG